MWHRAVFSFYIVVVTIGILDTLTRIFARQALEVHGLNRELVIQATIAQKKSVVQELCGILDKTHSGIVTVQQLVEHMKRTDVQAYLATQHLHNGNSRQIIKVLDPQETGQVTMYEFIAGCLQYRGPARSVDIASVLSEQRKQTKILQKLACNSKKQGEAPSQPVQLAVEDRGC